MGGVPRPGPPSAPPSGDRHPTRTRRAYDLDYARSRMGILKRTNGQVPPHPDHFCATRSRSARCNLDWKPHPSLEVVMSKVIGKPLAGEPSSPPSEAVDRSTRPPTNSASVNPLSMRGSVGLKASDSTERAGTITPALPTPPPGPRPRSRTWP